MNAVETIIKELRRLQEVETENQKINGELRTKLKEYEKIEQISKSVTLEDVERTARKFEEQYISKNKIKNKLKELKEIADEDNTDEFIKIKVLEELLGE